jgi:hypothetical protein
VLRTVNACWRSTLQAPRLFEPGRLPQRRFERSAASANCLPIATVSGPRGFILCRLSGKVPPAPSLLGSHHRSLGVLGAPIEIVSVPRQRQCQHDHGSPGMARDQEANETEKQPGRSGKDAAGHQQAANCVSNVLFVHCHPRTTQAGADAQEPLSKCSNFSNCSRDVTLPLSDMTRLLWHYLAELGPRSLVAPKPKHRRPKWLAQDCCGCWVFPFPFSCSCGRSVGCTRWPSRIAGKRMNGIFYLVGLIVVALLIVYALKLFQYRTRYS